MADEQVLGLLEGVPEKRIDSEKFDDIFQLDGIPLWFFMRPLIYSSFLPSPFVPLRNIEKEIEKNELPSGSERLKLKIKSYFVKRAFSLNEKIKYGISRSGKREIWPSGKKEVLFIASTDKISVKNGKIEYLEFEKILDSLKQNKTSYLVLAGEPFSKNSFFKLNSYGPLVYDYITLAIIEESRRISEDLHDKWKAMGDENKIKLFTNGGKNYWKFFAADMGLLFSKEVLFSLALYYLTFKEIFQKHGVKVVYLTDVTNFYGLAALASANKLGGRVVYSPHGYTRGPVKAWGLMKNAVVAAGGDELRRDLIKAGIPEKNIVVTGYPFLDEIVRYKKERPSGDKKTVTLLTTIAVESGFIGREEYFKVIRETLSQIKKVEEVEHVTIKLHPNEKFKSGYESAIKDAGLENAEVIQRGGKETLYSLLRDSDLLLGYGSTAVLEGLMMDKDAIHLEMLETRPVFEFKEATISVKKTGDLGKTVKRILTDERERKKLKARRDGYLKKAFYKIDGKSHERVAKLIKSLVK